MIVKQMTLMAGVETEVIFSEPHHRFLVKNFSDGDVKVSLNDHIVDNNFAIIPAQSWEKICNNEKNCWDVFAADKMYLNSESGGAVEVRVLC